MALFLLKDQKQLHKLLYKLLDDPIKPIGNVFCGFIASSAAVETASNPIYAKKMRAAPLTVPNHPNGVKGCQFSGRM